MSEGTNRMTKVLTVLVACLLAVAAFEGYYLFQVHQKLDTTTVSAQAQDAGITSSAGKPDTSWKLNSQATPPKQQEPLNSLSPFDPNTWDPFKEMDQMRKQMDQMFNQAFGHFSGSPKFGNLVQGPTFNPDMDISEDSDQYTVRMDVPGMDQSKINATLKDRVLTISGVRETEVNHSNAGKSIVQEREIGQFERSITLPGPVKEDGMKVNYDKGVLAITIPKEPSQKSAPSNIQ